jgi:hypothetical protein
LFGTCKFQLTKGGPVWQAASSASRATLDAFASGQRRRSDPLDEMVRRGGHRGDCAIGGIGTDGEGRVGWWGG